MSLRKYLQVANYFWVTCFYSVTYSIGIATPCLTESVLHGGALLHMWSSFEALVHRSARPKLRESFSQLQHCQSSKKSETNFSSIQNFEIVRIRQVSEVWLPRKFSKQERFLVEILLANCFQRAHLFG